MINVSKISYFSKTQTILKDSDHFFLFFGFAQQNVFAFKNLSESICNFLKLNYQNCNYVFRPLF